ncbi:uncharacterized protein [Asterias amurensis]|uniref:uncharacterized protein n=1 Tax=Asterias amurensis TaxID=7602 RepID=UPI003AB654AF
MSQLISPLTAVLLTTAYFIIADACVCYVGDEANSIKGEPPLKLLPDQNPCECTEFRPGGVNTKRQAKPREVKFGNDGHPEGWTDKDCIKGTTLMFTISMPPCDPWSLITDVGLNIPPFGESFQSYPVTLEFTLHGSTSDQVDITSYNKLNPICTVELNAVEQEMRIFEEFESAKDFQDAFDGSTHYWVTINQHKLEFGRLGETETLIACQTYKIIDDVTVWSQTDMTVAFYGTCPDAELLNRPS